MSETNELTERQRYWLAHIDACEQSGLLARTYADEHGLKVNSLYNARHLLKAKGVLCSTEAEKQPQVGQSIATEPKTRFQRVVVRPELEPEADVAALCAQRSSQGVAPCRIHLPDPSAERCHAGGHDPTDTAALTAVVVAAGAWP